MKTRLFLAAGLLCAIAAAGVIAEDKKDSSFGGKDEQAKAKMTPEAKAAAEVTFAFTSIEYGRQNRAPEALITAARILAAHPPRAMDEKGTRDGGAAPA